MILDRYTNRPGVLAEVAANHRAWVDLKRFSGSEITLNDELVLQDLAERLGDVPGARYDRAHDD